MKTILFTFLSAALICGCNCKAAFAQSQPNPFANASAKMIDLKVTGMTCQSCADQVTAALSEKKGVAKSDVMFTENKALVTYDPKVIKPEEIIAAIEAIGYKAELNGKNEKKEDTISPAHACCVPKKKN